MSETWPCVSLGRSVRVNIYIFKCNSPTQVATKITFISCESNVTERRIKTEPSKSAQNVPASGTECQGHRRSQGVSETCPPPAAVCACISNEEISSCDRWMTADAFCRLSAADSQRDLPQSDLPQCTDQRTSCSSMPSHSDVTHAVLACTHTKTY